MQLNFENIFFICSLICIFLLGLYMYLYLIYLYFLRFMFKYLAKKNLLKIKDSYKIESNFEIEKIKKNQEVKIIYDLDENIKPYYEVITYDIVIFDITVINVHLNKT